MADPEFTRLLEQLHQEIENTHNVGVKEKALLQEISKDIQKLLGGKGHQVAQPHPLTIQRLEESIGLLETTHPTLTNLMDKLLTILSNSGI